MPHQCVRCGVFYNDGDPALLKGCSCGSKFFFFMKNEDMEAAKDLTINLKKEEREQIEQDVMEMINVNEIDRPVVLDIENIRVLKPGQYEIDLIDLFKGKPLIYKLEDGKYIIDLISMFEKLEK